MTDIVVDLGCKAHGPSDSIAYLIKRFNPKVLFGFDPYPHLSEGARADESGTVVITRRRAAWIADQPLGFTFDGTRSRPDPLGTEVVSALDVARWLTTLPGRFVLKVDIEGCEFDVLPRIAKFGLGERIELLLVEWHMAFGTKEARSAILAQLGCRWEAWD